MEITKERFSEFEYQSIEINQSKEQWAKKLKEKHEQSLSDKIRGSKIHAISAISVLQEKDSGGMAQNILKIMAKNFPNLVKDINLYI